MEEILRLVQRGSHVEATVLIQGESGTGKELIARAAHAQSPRRTGPFSVIDCGTIPANLLESELFGHKRGAFTGAESSRKGLFEVTDGGTLLLDEVGELPFSLQVKLLRVLQEKEIRPVGSDRSRKIDVRILAATNKDLQEEITERRFREDLFYRINVIPVRVPSLREHKEDIPELVAHFAAGACRDNGWRKKAVTPEAVRLLAAGDYPGNIRELKNTVERLVILSPGDEVTVEQVRALTAPARPRARLGFTPGVPLRELVESAEREFIQAAMDAHGGNMTRTAESLGLERSHLYKKAKSLGIHR